MRKMTYEMWMKRIDVVIGQKFPGLNHLAFPDQPFVRWYEQGVTFWKAARRTYNCFM